MDVFVLRVVALPARVYFPSLMDHELHNKTRLWPRYLPRAFCLEIRVEQSRNSMNSIRLFVITIRKIVQPLLENWKYFILRYLHIMY